MERPIPNDRLFCCPSGWLAPNGDYYPCNWAEHDRYAQDLCNVGSSGAHGGRALTEQGWLKVCIGEVKRGELHDKPLTQPQIDKLHDLLPALASYLGNDSQPVKNLSEFLQCERTPTPG